MLQPKITDRERFDRALQCAQQLAQDLRVLGYGPQAQLVDEIAHALYSTKFNRAVADLAKR